MALTNLTTGAGSTGLKNYFSSLTTSNGINSLSGSFEGNSTASFSLAHTALSGVTPTSTATAGSFLSASSGLTAAASSLSFTTVSSGTQIAGSYSGNLASTGASTAGDCLLSSPFFIDDEDQAKVLQIKFYYQVASGGTNLNLSGSSSNSFALWVYDVLNGSWSQPAGVYNLVQSSGVGLCTATFQTSSNGTQYQIALVNINATGGAFSLLVDDFSVGPQVTVMAPAMSDWVSYTPTITGFGTPTNVDFKSRRVGDTLQVFGKFTCGVATTALAQITLGYLGGNANVVIDSSKIGTNNVVGYGGVSYSGSTSVYLNATGNTNYLSFAAAATGFSGIGPMQGTQLLTLGQTVSFQAIVPIVGWSSNSVASSDTDTRVISSKATLSATSGNFTTGVEAKVLLNSALSDPTGIFDSVNNRWNIAVTGDYFLSTSTNWSTQTGIKLTAYRVNGGSSQYFGMLPSGDRLPASTLIPGLKAGDYVEWWARQDSGGNATLAAGSASTTASLFRLSGPAVVQATESVNMRYTDTSNAAIGTSLGVFKYTTQIFDSHNAYNTSTGLYTVPVSGKYSIKAILLTTGVTLSTSQNFVIAVYKNGSYYGMLGQVLGNGVSNVVVCWGADDVNCLAGDTLAVYASSAVATTANTGANLNHLSIFRMGN
jgi:hypothetical protein